MNTAQESRKFRVIGVVQGVGFRFWTLRQAHRMGLGGYVRNAADGSVEVCARGPADRLQEFQAMLHRGPPGSRVASVEAVELASDSLPDPFEIRR
ncbi:MAG: acylphosphatase [Longimicrobiales bacterium]